MFVISPQRFCGRVYRDLHAFVGVRRGHLAVVSGCGGVFSGLLTMAQTDSTWVFGLQPFIITMASLLLWSDHRNRMVTSTGGVQSQPLDSLDVFWWQLLLVTWTVFLPVEGQVRLPGVWWWYVTARGFMALPDEGDGTPFVVSVGRSLVAAARRTSPIRAYIGVDASVDG